MPEFAPGEAKTAVAPITVSPSGLACQAEVFLGPDQMTKVTTSGSVAFISTGAEQSTRLPITMPAEEGTYHVFIDVYAEGILIAAYRAIEDVTIVAPVVPTEPQLVYAYPAEAQVVSGGTLYINYKVGVPDIADKLIFLFPLEGVRCWTPYGCANASFGAGTTAGYYEGSTAMYIKYMIDHFEFANVPPGVYRLLSTCELYRDGTLVKTYWRAVDTGETVIVV